MTGDRADELVMEVEAIGSSRTWEPMAADRVRNRLNRPSVRGGRSSSGGLNWGFYRMIAVARLDRLRRVVVSVLVVQLIAGVRRLPDPWN
ncbi:hypothetical protein ACQPZQ_13595 [Pseudonocardia sp. CA-142604]|uniref:hypothetical protein n=1 Tax=Pseudonocardia sp. CA-142604 TaxID=3240024 RepID=UPI003D93FC38